jgi:phosphoribosyl 1,2-cyclic phosphodiesterase/CheY-like chemotaxis protein
MRVRFWGTRGSISKPGPQTLRYGGNTSCVEVRTAAGTLIVLDCGTGAHGLGRALLEDGTGPPRGHLLISHTHWDHIQGLPFFDPFFVEGGEWDVYGPRGLGGSVLDILAGQMQYTYFPISLDQFAADVHYHDLVEGALEIGDVRITSRYLNHPALTLGYRLEADGVVLVYATDHEPHARQGALTDEAPRSPEDERHLRFLEDADLVIHDAQYTADEYPAHLGWGHSPIEFAVDTASAAGAHRLALFHHDPLRTDAALDGIVEQAQERAARAAGRLDVLAAAEGRHLDLESRGRTRRRREPAQMAAATEPAAEPLARAVLVAVRDPESAAALAEAVRADGLRLLVAEDAETLLRVVASERPSVVILERELGGRDALDLCRSLRSPDRPSPSDPVLVVLAQPGENVDADTSAQAGVTDWLVAPVRTAYARTRLRCWLLRTACRWIAAPRPQDEEKRVRALHSLGVLDTEPEERFDRHTRIAAALFDTPIALVSLIDVERQWFKSRHGLDASETPREMAFCAHAILGDDVLLISDALKDSRFADNPLVTGPPFVRFYAGVPLHVADGNRVGTLCVIDHRPRYHDEKRLDLLRDVAKLVERELQTPPAPRPARAGS